MRLQAVEPRRLYRQIADQIRALIGSGEVAPGARWLIEGECAALTARAAARRHMEMAKNRCSKEWRKQ